MRWAAVIVGAARIASAQPADLDACKARRHALTIEAMRAPTIVERGRRLAELPECRVRDDGSVEVVEPVHEPPPPPFPPKLAFAVTVGVDTWAISSTFGEPTRVAPRFDVGIGARIRPSVVVLSHAGATTVPMQGVLATPAPMPPYVDNHAYAGSEYLFEAGLRAQVEHRSLVLGAGLGVQVDHTSGTAIGVGAIEMTHLRGLVEGEIGYAFVVDRLQLQALAIAADANGSWIGGVGNTTSVGLAIRAQL